MKAGEELENLKNEIEDLYNQIVILIEILNLTYSLERNLNKTKRWSIIGLLGSQLMTYKNRHHYLAQTKSNLFKLQRVLNRKEKILQKRIAEKKTSFIIPSRILSTDLNSSFTFFEIFNQWKLSHLKTDVQILRKNLENEISFLEKRKEYLIGLDK